MRLLPTALLSLAALAIAEPALAQQANYNVSWAALNPGNDWAAQVLQSLFPMYGAGNAPSTGNEATVIGQIVGQFTGFVAAIAAAFVCYNTIMNIHRAAESSRILGSGNTWMFVVRVGFAGIMMFPLGNGFSAGQGLVYQSAMWGIGMAKALYTNAIQAVGPDAVVVAQPMVPGTEQVILGLIDNELCADLVNLASNTNNMIPPPTPMTGPTRAAEATPRSITRCPSATSPALQPAAPSQSRRQLAIRPPSPDSRLIWRRSSRLRSATF